MAEIPAADDRGSAEIKASCFWARLSLRAVHTCARSAGVSRFKEGIRDG